ncbi:hypothetical protein [Nocardia tengchongensis]|uniref:hypothetical protein n=1 Tax=Nocardia tengchongensis TaxID=2055889 RepID=UPI00364AF509
MTAAGRASNAAEPRTYALPRVDLFHRRRLKPEHFAGIGAFRRLRTVRLAFNGLEDLPPDFDTLPDLETVDLDRNRFPREVRDRITAAHPSARMDFGS